MLKKPWICTMQQLKIMKRMMVSCSLTRSFFCRCTKQLDLSLELKLVNGCLEANGRGNARDCDEVVATSMSNPWQCIILLNIQIHGINKYYVIHFHRH